VIVCAAANPSIDKLFVVDAVTPGAIHRPERLVVRAGGKGLNVARAAHSLGADVVAVTLLGGHAGRWIAEELVEAGVRTDAVWTEGETRTSLSVAANGALTEFYERGVAPGPEAWEQFVARVGAAVRGGGAGGASWLAISGSLPPQVAPEESAVLVRAGHQAGVRVAVDQHGPTLAAALDAGPDLVKVNRHEAAELTGAEDPARAAAALRDRLAAAGARDPTAVVTLGAEGAVALTGAAMLAGNLDVLAPYPVGSGDAFLAGLLTARAAGAGWDAALAAALGAGSANAEAEGAGTLDAGRARALAAGGRIHRQAER
jgi:1-phosphofructokinase family hexose kinase